MMKSLLAQRTGVQKRARERKSAAFRRGDTVPKQDDYRVILGTGYGF
jgi:hypothetical protein